MIVRMLSEEAIIEHPEYYILCGT